MKYFAFDQYNGDYEFYDTEEEAKKAAEGFLQYYADDASIDGWPEDLTDSIGYGKVISTTRAEVTADRKDFTDEEWEDEGYSLDFNKIVDYELT